MDKILVEIYLPAANMDFDVYIPYKSKFHEVRALLTTAFAGMSGGYYGAASDGVICDKESGEVLDINLSAEELGLLNGSKLMLI